MALFGGGQQSNTSVPVKKYEKGEIIVQEGSTAGEMFVLMSGSVGLYKNYQKFNQADMGSLRTGDCFGEASMFMNKPQAVTVVATADASAILLTAKTAADIFAKKPDLAYSVMAGFVKKLDDMTRKTAQDSGAQAGVNLSKTSALFPEGHGSYSLPMMNDNATSIYKQGAKCPLCGTAFENLFVLTSRLRRESTDKDLRVRYAGVEPMYYDIISCPNCLFSAPSDKFSEASPKFADNVNKELNKFLGEVEIKTGMERDTFTVFAGYYLALRCMPIVFDDYMLPVAGMWQKLSRLYKDCVDETMYLTATMQAITEYEQVYQKVYLNEKQSQQICYILGDLYDRVENYDKAKNFFFLAKSNREGTPAMKIEADKRLDEIKEKEGLK